MKRYVKADRAVSPRPIKVTPAKGISACNICFARNYEPDMENAIGSYDPDLYDVLIGTQMICMCKSCMKDVSELLNQWS